MEEKEKQEQEQKIYYNNSDNMPQAPVVYTKSKGNFVFGLLLGMMIAMFIMLAMTMISNRKEKNDTNQALNMEEIEQKVNLLQSVIDYNYLNEVSAEDMKQGMYKGLLSSLGDPYSVYYTPEEYKESQDSIAGSYCGIGTYVSQNATTKAITITKVFEGGPAEKAGILPEDTIVGIDDEDVQGQDLQTVASKMKGEEGTKVKVKVKRAGSDKELTFDITRKKVDVQTVSYKMLEGKIGYITVSEFDDITVKQFTEAMTDLEKQGMEGLVIDLRNNPGGLLPTVVDMLDHFIEKDNMIVYMKDKHDKKDEYKAKTSEHFDKPMAVLINGGSASASEIFAGAIQDYNIGTIVGTKSFGKGIVQNVFPLTDGSAVKVTVSKYYTPKGRNIHGTGIEPDELVELSDEAKKQPTLDPKDDNQLQKAIEVVKDKMKK